MGRIKPQALLLQSKKKKGPSRISISTIVLCNLIIVVLMLSLVAMYRQRAKGATNQSSSGSDTKGIKIIEDSVHINIPHQAEKSYGEYGPVAATITFLEQFMFIGEKMSRKMTQSRPQNCSRRLFDCCRSQLDCYRGEIWPCNCPEVCLVVVDGTGGEEIA